MLAYIVIFLWLQSNPKAINTEGGLALDGYDAISYFEGKLQKGQKNFQVKTNGATYYFSTKQHEELFRKQAHKYMPQYGGWCAYAMGLDGEKVSVNPETYKIIEGKLYLFYNKYFSNTLIKWNKNEAQLKAQADKNWQKFN